MRSKSPVYNYLNNSLPTCTRGYEGYKNNGDYQEIREPDFVLSEDELKGLNSFLSDINEGEYIPEIFKADGFYEDNGIVLKLGVSQKTGDTKYGSRLITSMEAKIEKKKNNHLVFSLNFGPEEQLSYNGEKKCILPYANNLFNQRHDSGNTLNQKTLYLVDDNNKVKAVDMRPSIQYSHDISSGRKKMDNVLRLIGFAKNKCSLLEFYLLEQKDSDDFKISRLSPIPKAYSKSKYNKQVYKLEPDKSNSYVNNVFRRGIVCYVQILNSMEPLAEQLENYLVNKQNNRKNISNPKVRKKSF